MRPSSLASVSTSRLRRLLFGGGASQALAAMLTGCPPRRLEPYNKLAHNLEILSNLIIYHVT